MQNDNFETTISILATIGFVLIVWAAYSAWQHRKYCDLAELQIKQEALSKWSGQGLSPLMGFGESQKCSKSSNVAPMIMATTLAAHAAASRNR